jgi:hypothetical protein
MRRILACMVLCVSCSGNEANPKAWCKSAVSAIESIEKRNAEYGAQIKAAKPQDKGSAEATPAQNTCELYISAVAFAHGVSYGLHAGLMSGTNVNDFALTFLNNLLIDTRACTAENAEKLMVEFELLVSKERLALERTCK